MQQAKQAVADAKNTFYSGGPGTTGREVFEDSSATGPGAAYTSSGLGSSTGSTGATSGLTGGHSGSTGATSGLGSAGSTGYSGGSGVGSTTSAGAPTSSSGQYSSLSSSGGGLNRPDQGVSQSAAGVAGIGSGEHHHHGHHGHHHGSTGAGSAGGAVGATGTTGATQQESATGPIGADEPSRSYGGSGGNAPAASTDKTGHLGQDSHLYERTGQQGPLTTGAAGTEIGDRSSASGGSSTAAPSEYRVPEGEAGSAPKKSGGLMGLLATSDKDFTSNPGRTGSGAYADTDGHFKLNSDGPQGNSALTGREGTNPAQNNPVARAESKDVGRVSSDLNRGDSGVSDGSPKKKGFMDKVKEALT